MPHATYKHLYEGIMAGFVTKLAAERGIDPRACVLVELDAAGEICGVRTLERGAQMRSTVDALERYAMLDPFDIPEYMWLEWRGIPREVAQRLTGEELPAEFPSQAGVMF